MKVFLKHALKSGDIGDTLGPKVTVLFKKKKKKTFLTFAWLFSSTSGARALSPRGTGAWGPPCMRKLCHGETLCMGWPFGWAAPSRVLSEVLSLVVSVVGMGWLRSRWDAAPSPTLCLMPKGNKACPRAGGGQSTSKLPFTFLLRVPKPGKANYPNVVAASLLLSEVTLEDNLIYCRSYFKCLLLLFCLVNGGRATEMKVDGGWDWLTFGAERGQKWLWRQRCLRNAWGFERPLLK